ncbi:alpha/beta hydrolase [bacterium]|nr:MAG: alpha/beta hydrolase [bacterium]
MLGTQFYDNASKKVQDFISSLNMHTETFNLQVDSYSIECIKWGEKKPEYLFIHGFGGSAKTFMKVIELLHQQGKASLSISLPFHGRSSDSTISKLFDLADFGSSLENAIKTQFGVNQIHLVAHSLGVRVQLWLAVNRPQWIKSVQIMNPAGFYPWEIRFFSSFKKGFGARLIQNDRIGKLVVSFLVPNPSARVIQAFRWYAASYDLMCLHRTKIFIQLFKIQTPVHIYWGDSDRLLPEAFAYEVRQHFSAAEVHIIKNCGHLPMIQQTNEITRLLLQNSK